MKINVNKTHVAIIGLCIMLIVVCIMYIRDPELSDQYEQQLQSEIKLLQEQNDSLLKTNIRLEIQASELTNQSDSLTQIYLTEYQTIVRLKSKANEKIQAIDTLSNDELFEFFARFKADTTRF